MQSLCPCTVCSYHCIQLVLSATKIYGLNNLLFLVLYFAANIERVTFAEGYKIDYH